MADRGSVVASYKVEHEANFNLKAFQCKYKLSVNPSIRVDLISTPYLPRLKAKQTSGPSMLAVGGEESDAVICISFNESVSMNSVFQYNMMVYGLICGIEKIIKHEV